jgi:transposase-like protein
MATKRRSFTREFKLEAVRLLEAGEKSAAQLARELDLPRNRLYKWQEQLQGQGAQGAFPGRGRRRGAAGELAKLERENARLREENEILKKAARYFARESS